MARQNLFFCNGVRINSIADLYDNFNLQDIINARSSGKLQQWLIANGFHAECEAISQMDLSVEDADVQILKVLKCPEEKQIAYLQKKREIAEREAREKAEAEAELKKLAAVAKKATASKKKESNKTSEKAKSKTKHIAKTKTETSRQKENNSSKTIRIELNENGLPNASAFKSSIMAAAMLGGGVAPSLKSLIDIKKKLGLK